VRAGAERLYGFHPVCEALRARKRRLDRLAVRQGLRRADLERLLALAEAAAVPVSRVPEAALARGLPPGARTQGLVLEVGPLPTVSLDEALGAGEAGTRRVLALDGVEDPQNVGALLRVADAAGASAALLPERHAPPLSGAVAKASAGALEHLPIARVTNLARALHAAKARGFWIVALDPEEGGDLFASPDALWRADLVVVVGAEGSGLRRATLVAADHRVAIPMRGHVASLNVAAAGAVALFEAVRRLRS
jgi:23S rRNA (guanosine2251-2'-O)-methyltransferase